MIWLLFVLVVMASYGAVYYGLEAKADQRGRPYRRRCMRRSAVLAGLALVLLGIFCWAQLQ